MGDVFGTVQPPDPDHNSFTLEQFTSVVMQRMFPSTYTFTGKFCFNDPNEALNQNDYTSVASTSKAWNLEMSTPFPIAAQTQCKSRTSGLSQLSGEIFFGTGTISTTLKGSGQGYLDFGNCGIRGSVSVTLGGTIIKKAKISSTLSQFNFTNGQKLKLS